MGNNLEIDEAAGDSANSVSDNLPITLADAASFIKSGKSFDITAAAFSFAHGVPIPPSLVGRIRVGLERVIGAGIRSVERMIERRTEHADFDAKLQLEIVAKAAREGVKGIPADSADRITMSYLIEHQRKYANRSAVVVEALGSLASGTTLIDESPDAELSEDWLNFFADVAAQKSSTEMQQLMGRILAGEIRQPGRFSPLTIHALSTLTQKVAKKFERLCEAAINMDGEVIVPALVSLDLASRGIPDLEIEYVDMLHLRSYGLLASERMSRCEFRHDETSHITYAGKHFTARLGPEATAPASFEVVMFSQVGRELHSLLVPPEETEFEKWFKDTFAKHGVEITTI